MKHSIKLIALITAMFLPGIVLAQDYMNLSEIKSKLPVREMRRTAITGNAGWNGLSGFGITVNQFISKNFEVDAGVGLAATGIKVGARMNYIFLDKKFSPIATAGFMYGFGSNGQSLEYNGEFGTFTYTISGSPFLQVAFGIEYVAKGGFMIKALTGYAFLTIQKNYNIVYGIPTSDELSALDIALGSGIVMEVSIGYAFGNK